MVMMFPPPLFNPRPRRDFTPNKTRRFGHPTFPMDRLVKFSPKWGYARMFNFPYRGSHWRPRMQTIVVSVDGVSKGNHLTGDKLRGSWGVFFGHNSPRNISGVLSPNLTNQTNNHAELEAVRQALLAIRHMYTVEGVFRSFSYNEIIIMTDSSYVHDTFDTYVWAYECNGYTKADGTIAKHWSLIRQIHYLIRELEGWNRNVRFWKVDKEFVAEADALANRALDVVELGGE